MTDTTDFDVDATEEFILYRCGGGLTPVISEVFRRLRDAERQRDWQSNEYFPVLRSIIDEQTARIAQLEAGAVPPLLPTILKPVTSTSNVTVTGVRYGRGSEK